MPDTKRFLGKIAAILGMVFLLWPALLVRAQDPTGVPLSPEQMNLLSQIDAADADQRSWQSYTTLSFNSQFYSETLVVSFGDERVNQETTNSTITTLFDGNPLTGGYSSDVLLTLERREQQYLSAEEQRVENYTLLAELVYRDNRLYVQALRNGGSENLPPMPELGWYDLTDNLDRFPALDPIRLRRYLPEAPLPATPNPILDTDFFVLTRGTNLRSLVADIVLVNDNEVLTEGPNAGTTVRQIRIQLNPLAMLRQAFAGFEGSEELVASFANENVDMSLTVWLDASTSRRVREQFVFVLQGEPDPTLFGYAPGEFTTEGGLRVLYQLERDISYIDINAPVEIPVPDIQ
ncbi:MAG: hypothetical protein GYB66_08275 [Chloroflexi bacterium]|nr:hypothetical protein [Chloroflexota bacterium]